MRNYYYTWRLILIRYANYGPRTDVALPVETGHLGLPSHFSTLSPVSGSLDYSERKYYWTRDSCHEEDVTQSWL